MIQSCKYLVFSGQTYYPVGGWGDYQSSYDDYEDARSACLALMGLGGQAKDLDVADWGHVVDMSTGKICFQVSGQTRVTSINKVYNRVRELHCVAWDSQGNMVQSILTL